jgi:hypothetical protein
MVHLCHLSVYPLYEAVLLLAYQKIMPTRISGSFQSECRPYTVVDHDKHSIRVVEPT